MIGDFFIIIKTALIFLWSCILSSFYVFKCFCYCWYLSICRNNISFWKLHGANEYPLNVAYMYASCVVCACLDNIEGLSLQSIYDKWIMIMMKSFRFISFCIVLYGIAVFFIVTCNTLQYIAYIYGVLYICNIWYALSDMGWRCCVSSTGFDNDRQKNVNVKKSKKRFCLFFGEDWNTVIGNQWRSCCTSSIDETVCCCLEVQKKDNRNWCVIISTNPKLMTKTVYRSTCGTFAGDWCHIIFSTDQHWSDFVVKKVIQTVIVKLCLLFSLHGYKWRSDTSSTFTITVCILMRFVISTDSSRKS